VVTTCSRREILTHVSVPHSGLASMTKCRAVLCVGDRMTADTGAAASQPRGSSCIAACSSSCCACALSTRAMHSVTGLRSLA